MENASALKELYRITDEDLESIRNFKDFALENIDELIDSWYATLKEQPEFDQFFSDPATLERVQKLQVEYWEEFLSADIDDRYIGRRQDVGQAHARIGLPLNTYFAGMNGFLALFEAQLRRSEADLERRANATLALAKLLHLDGAVVVETYNQIVEETITAQSNALLQMSTPVTEIWKGILLLPIVGIVDSARAGDIMSVTLAKIGETQARIFILDISGVGVVDTAVANNLIKITRATRLMGCECTISGLSPSIAQTIVDLGIDVGRVKTTSTMRDALSDAFQRFGMEITQSGS